MPSELKETKVIKVAERGRVPSSYGRDGGSSLYN